MSPQINTYSCANARIRAMISNLLQPSFFTSLIDSSGLSQFIDMLKGTCYKDIFEKVSSDLTSVESGFLTSNVFLYKKIAKLFNSKKEKGFILLLLEKYEIEQVKSALKIREEGKGVEEYLFIKDKIIYPINYKTLASANSIDDAIKLLVRTPYAKPLLMAKKKYSEEKSLFCLENAIDEDYYKRIKYYIKKLTKADSDTAKRLMGAVVDIENLYRIVRFKRYYKTESSKTVDAILSGGRIVKKDTFESIYSADSIKDYFDKTGLKDILKENEREEDEENLIEMMCNEILSGQIRKTLSGYPFTIDIAVSYLLLRERETKKIISLMYAKDYGLNKEQTRRLVLC